MFTLDRESAVPLTEQLEAELRRRIAGGQLAPGARLPSIRQLASRLGVSAYTVVNAYDRLVAAGVVEARATSGLFVKGRVEFAPEVALGSEGAVDTRWLSRRLLSPGVGTITAGTAFVPGHWVEGAITPAFVAKALRAKPAFVTGTTQGMPELREQLAIKLRGMSIPADPARILVTYGASQAIDLVCRALVHEGDTVLVEDPVYLVLLDRLRETGARLVAIPRTPEGPDLDAIERACREHKPRLFFMQSLLHNPTGWDATPAVLHRILELASRHDFLVAEDDVYGDMHPGNPVRLATLAGLERVIYFSSFTKVLNPAWRVGYVAAEPALIDALVTEKMRAVLTGSLVEETVVAEMLRTGIYRKHLQVLRNKLATARATTLKNLLGAGLEVPYPAEHGIFLWAALPPMVDVDELVRSAWDAGILLAKGALFRASDDGNDRHLRFNAATSTDLRVADFLRARTRAAESAGRDIARLGRTDDTRG
ncbi:MAG: PLP-dependent aminotransferase family protein [Gammaproteobacteria bacterium]